MGNQLSKRIHTIVIGGGQAGLAVGYYLKRRGIPFLILDANPRIGDAWRNRWDSLRLFTPARYDSLPGLRFPARGDSFPTKDDMADYLESYAAHFRLPVQTGVKVDRLSKEGHHFVVSSGQLRLEAEQVVVAMSNYQVPKPPAFAAQLDSGILQLHSRDYKNLSQLQKGGVLVVGVGNSGADIGLEVARAHPTWLSGTEAGHIPWPIEGFFGRHIGFRIVRFIGHRVLNVNTPIGRKQRPKFLHRTAPLIRVKPKHLTAAGIQRVPRVTGAKDGKPLLADGRVFDVKNVIWCTGFHPGFSWIDLPIFDEIGDPRHDRGVVAEAPGLYFVGLQFLSSMTSATVTGVGRDAERIANAIALQVKTSRGVTAERVLTAEAA